MSVKFNSSGGGSVTLDAPSTASNLTVTLPSASGTLVSTGSPFAGGTANGVVYLNGSSVPTAGSALTFDGTTLSNSGYYKVADDGQYFWGSGSTSILGSASAGRMQFYVSGSEQMRLTSTGLGIGTSNPNPQSGVFTPYLTVKGASYDGVMQVLGSRGDGANTGVGQFNFLQDGNTTYKTVAQVTSETEGATANNRGGRLMFFTKADGATSTTERMRIDSSGNVGIGTSSPDGTRLSLLGVSGETVQRVLHLGYNGSMSIGTNGVYLSFGQNNPSASQLARIASYYEGGTYMGSLRFYTNANSDGANPTERMRIDSSGNVGIGVTPSYKFHIKGSGSTSSTLSMYVQNSANTELFFIRDDGAIETGEASLSPYNNTTANAANMLVDSTGRLYRSTSSIKYKTDVQDAIHGLAEVLKLRPVTYKGQKDGDTVFGGLIAEEVDAIGLTEFVQYAKDGSPDALAYGNMVSLLAKAIQELKAELDATKAEVAALKAGA